MPTIVIMNNQETLFPAEKAASRMKISFFFPVYNDAMTVAPTIEKARAVLGWKPLFSLVQGLERTIAWYREFFAQAPTP